jgi:hypothetical protein
MPARDRLTVAELAGTAHRFSTRRDATGSDTDAVTALRAISTDPTLLGVAAGSTAADPHGVADAAVRLLLAAGADPDIAGDVETTTRARMAAAGITFALPPRLPALTGRYQDPETPGNTGLDPDPRPGVE